LHKDVLVTVKGTRTDDLGEKETIELITVGRFFCKKRSYYIVYSESEVSGLEGTTTSVKAEQNRVTLNRVGSSEHKQVFEEGVHNRGNYTTPYGNLPTRVLPWKVEVDLTEVGGSINLEYELELNRQKIGYNELIITVEEIRQ